MSVWSWEHRAMARARPGLYLHHCQVCDKSKAQCQEQRHDTNGKHHSSCTLWDEGGPDNTRGGKT